DEDGGTCRESMFINHQSPLPADETTPAPDEAPDLRALGDRLRRAVDTLPPRERLVIEMHYFADKDLQEVGAALGAGKWTGARPETFPGITSNRLVWGDRAHRVAAKRQRRWSVGVAPLGPRSRSSASTT